MRSLTYLLLIALGLPFCPDQVAAAQGRWELYGVRGGFAVDDKDKGARQYEAFAMYQLPWELRSSSGWGIATKIELTAGALKSQGEYGFIGSVGPSFGLGSPTFPVEIGFGISGAVLSRDRFGNRDYNGNEQFISHIGVIYRLSPRFGLSYRFQHMSNAGFNGSPNPGLNMHLFDASWYFSR